MIYSLRNKVALTFLVLFTIPLITIILLLSREAEAMIGSSIETTAFQSMDQYSTYILTVMEQAENVGQQVINSSFLQNWTDSLTNKGQSEYEKYKIKQDLRQYFYSLIQFNPDVVSIEAYDNQGGITGLQSGYPDESYLKSRWYADAKESITWLKAGKDAAMSEDSAGSEVNSLTVPIVNMTSLSTMGVLKVNVKTELLKQPLEKIQLGRSGFVFLVDDKGASILGQDMSDVKGLSGLDWEGIAADADAEGRLQMKQGENDSIIFYRKLKGFDWILIGWVPRQDLYAKVTQTKRTLLLLSGLLLLLIVPSAYWLSAGIARPLSKLARAMRYAEKGEWRTAEEITPARLAGKNEVGYVITVFHTMLINLQNLIKAQYELILQRKDAEYKALLLQINPHFLYNTLGVIGALSAQKKHEEVMDVTESLGQMLRYSLKLDSNLVSLSEELLYTRRYIHIIGSYYGDAVEATVREEAGLGGAQIVKFILQPLVENAVKYSLNNESGGPAKVLVRVGADGDRLRIAISDNGVGMTPEQVRELNEEEREGDGMLRNAGQEIGLRNVLTRCRLFYGEAFSFDIASAEHKGTEIILSLPGIKR